MSNIELRISCSDSKEHEDAFADVCLLTMSDGLRIYLTKSHELHFADGKDRQEDAFAVARTERKKNILGLGFEGQFSATAR